MIGRGSGSSPHGSSGSAGTPGTAGPSESTRAERRAASEGEARADGDRIGFRWDILAFVAILALVLILSTALLVLLDPRSQAWWGDRFSDLGAFVRSILDAITNR